MKKLIFIFVAALLFSGCSSEENLNRAIKRKADIEKCREIGGRPFNDLNLIGCEIEIGEEK